MRRFHTVLGLSSFLAVGAILMAPTTISSAKAAENPYVACNSDGACWRVRQIYAYGEDRPITYHSAEWYDAHKNDANIRWLPDPPDDRGYYDRDRVWRADPGARAVTGGVTGAALGAAIGCIVTIPIGCAPGAGVGAAVGGGVGAVGGAATTPKP
jgi:hypothetical protein